MMSFFHVLLFHVICVVSVQAVDTLIGCQPHPSPHVIDEKLSKGTEVVIFQNIKNITISGTDLHFSVTKQSGNNYAITVNEPYVYETLQSSRIQVQFTCVELSGAEVSVELLFIIQNVQDIPPDFGDKTYFHFNISENSAYGTEVGRLVVNAIDGDGNNVVSFNFTTIGTPFAIEWPLQNTPNRYKTGVISLIKPQLLDFETKQEYDLTVTATIRDTHLSSTATVHITVTDVDDMPPRFNNGDGYVKSISEKIYNHHEVIQLLATDQDTGPSRSQDIRYGLLKVFPDTTQFQVANTTGEVYVNGNLDRETCASYLLLIKAYQADKPELRMDITTLNITVTDVDDNPPVLSQTHYNVRIPENTPSNVSVLTITATDADEGPNAEFHYHIKSEGNQGGFTIDPATGILRVNNGSMLDREMHPKWTLQVFAASILNNSIKSHDAEVIVDLLDENDNSPKFTSTFYIFTVNKTISISSTIGIVKANDTDKGDNGMVVYQLVGDESQRFNISDTGTIEAVKALDSNYEPWYRFTVIASDQAPEPNRRKTSVQVTVHVNDVNVNTPQFINIIKSISVQEDIQIGSEVLLLQADDQDPTDNLTFILVHEQDFRLQTVDNRSATILINNALDRERTPEGYNLTLKVTDSLHTSTATLSVIIEDVNDNAPIFNPATYSFSVNEGVSNQGIGNLTATDQDKGNNGSVEYTLLPPWDGNFSIDQTGQIKVKSALDRESLVANSGQISLLVLAKDKGTPPLMTSATVTIHVGDVNDHAPHFKEKELSITINEGQMIMRHIEAYDEDDGRNQAIHYFIGNSNISTVEIQNGTLRSKAPLTYGVYEVEVIAYNTVPYTVSGLKNGTMTVYINVKDLNDHGPHFNRSSYGFSLPENFNVGHLVNRSIVWIHADDADETSEFNTVTYSVVEKDSYFEIDPVTATLRLIKPLDFEKAKYVHFKVMATDGDPNHQETVNVNVTILDVNDNAPVFSLDIYKCSVEEKRIRLLNCSTNIHATDNDTVGNNGKLTYSIEGPIKDIFSINSSTGELRPTSPLDADAGPSLYAIKIKAVDGGSPPLSGTAVVEVTVTNVNDNTPVIHGPSHITIPENLPINTTVGSLYATDVDINDNLTFTLSTTDYYGQFSIRSDEGVGYVILNRHLDREVNSSYVLEVKVMDTANHTNSTSLNITILDVNDNKPEFLNDTYNVTVNEGPDSDLLTIRTEADDIDEGSNAELEYSIISQDFGHHFVIGNTTGVISVLTSLNREDTSIYTLVIQAADQGETRLSGTATVFVNVEDINDCVPEFQQTSYSASVMEGSPSGTSVIHLTAVDKDVLPINRNISYLILDNQDLFDVNDNGVLTLTHEVVLGNHPTPYHIQIEATDGEYNTAVNVTVSVTDVNDHDPVFNETFYLFSVPENDEFPHPPSVLVGSVSATDEDPGKNGEVSYSILSTEVPVFIISRENGSIITNGTLDRDRCVNSRYTFTVIATDNGNATRTGLVEVTVTISDINDNWPEFTSDHYDGNIIENSDVGTEVNIHPAILASDIDAGNNGTDGILFYLSTDSPFEINSTNGRIFVKNKELDREKQETYNLEVIAIDQLGAGNNKSVPLTITLADANDEPPVFTHNISVFTINENAKSSDLVGSIHTSDADVGGNVSTRYNIVSGGDGRFYIDPISGEIIVTGGLDREQKDNYTLTIRATDGVNSAKAEVDVIIEDANDNSPIFPSNPVVINVTESDANISRIYTFTAYDKDLGENAVLTYFINQSDADASTFYVTEDGILSTIQPIDRETVDSYSFLVHVHDNGTPSLSAGVTVLCQVLDSNDNSPIFYDSNGNETTEYKTSILEKSPVGSPVFFPYVRDEDLGLNSAVHFQLLGAKRDLFQCNQKNGVVTIAKRIEINSLLDGRHDNETATYVGIILTVMATDQGQPSKSTNLTLHVTVEQISDENPVFDHELYQFNVSESTQSGSYIGDVKASMPNVSNYHLTYSIVTHSSLLILEKDQGRITLNNTLDREESDLHTFIIQVTDGKTPERTAFTMVNIRVIDVNDNAPHFNKPSYEYTITEGTYTMFTFGNLSATDRDTGRNAVIKYSLVNYTGEIFDVDISTGALVVNGTIDREENTEHTLLLQAKDQGVPALNTTVVVRVKIEDINDNSPKFLQTNYTCFVLENAPYEQICNVSATDEDQGYNGTVVYSFQDSDIPFYINPIDGTISKTGTTDFETKNIYNITIEANDLGSPELSSSVSLVIVIGDVPDTPPHFPRRVYDISTSSFTPLHTVLLNVTAGDGDVIYTIPDSVDDAQNTFCIDHVSGVIYLCRAMVPKQSTYVLTVEAEDANLTDTTVVVIHVRNEPASFRKSNYTADVMENHVGVLLDLNTTEELTGIPVHYTLVSVQPKDNGFIVNATTGEIYCSNELDRERVKTYTLVVSAEKVRNSDRSKRSTGESLGQVTVIVRVGDMNDNPPQFPPDTKLLYRVPSSLRVTSKVAELQAIDPDENSIVTYHLENSDELPFILRESDKAAKVLLKNHLERPSYNLTVSATDQDGYSANVTLTVITIPDTNRLTYVIPMSPQEFEKQEKKLIANLSSVLGVNVTTDGYDTHVDPSKTGLRIIARNMTTGRLLTTQELSSLISSKFADIYKLFHCTGESCYVHSKSIMTAPEIALLVIAVLIFVTGILVIFIGNHLWKQFHKAREEEMKMWELESFRSNAGSHIDNGTVNPNITNIETSFADLDNSGSVSSGLAANKKRTVLYESQELTMNFDNDAFCLEPPVTNGADSGVENDSSSNSSNTDEIEAPSPDVFRGTGSLGQTERPGRPDQGTSKSTEHALALPSQPSQASLDKNQRTVLQIDMDTGDTSDDNIDTDYEEKLSINSTDSKSIRSSDPIVTSAQISEQVSSTVEIPETNVDNANIDPSVADDNIEEEMMTSF